MRCAPTTDAVTPHRRRCRLDQNSVHLGKDPKIRGFFLWLWGKPRSGSDRSTSQVAIPRRWGCNQICADSFGVDFLDRHRNRHQRGNEIGSRWFGCSDGGLPQTTWALTASGINPRYSSAQNICIND
jgi:hypothetical protein